VHSYSLHTQSDHVSHGKYGKYGKYVSCPPVHSRKIKWRGNTWGKCRVQTCRVKATCHLPFDIFDTNLPFDIFDTNLPLVKDPGHKMHTPHRRCQMSARRHFTHSKRNITRDAWQPDAHMAHMVHFVHNVHMVHFVHMVHMIHFVHMVHMIQKHLVCYTHGTRYFHTSGTWRPLSTDRAMKYNTMYIKSGHCQHTDTHIYAGPDFFCAHNHVHLCPSFGCVLLNIYLQVYLLHIYLHIYFAHVFAFVHLLCKPCECLYILLGSI